MIAGKLSLGAVRRRLVVGVVAFVVVAGGVLGFVASSADAVVPANGLLHERWDGITGSSIASLTGNAAYPDSPDFSGFLTTEFRTPFPVNNVGQRVRGFYTPPTTGDYIFGVAADDRAELYVSTDMTPANAVLVAHVPFWTGTDQFDKYLPEQQSAAIPLVAGTKYYIEALHKNGANGPGRMSVAAKLVGGLPPLAVIPAADLMPWEDDPGGPVTVWVPVATPSDDAEERPTGQVLRNSSDLEMVVDGVTQVVGIRFASVDVPAGVTIDEAYIQFTTDEATSGTTDLTIEGELDPDPGTFTTTPFSISTRTRTFADVSWSPGPWTSIGAAGAAQQTEDLKTIVDELIGQGGWASGQSMVFIIEGDPTGKRVAEAYDGAPGAAAVLHITYTPVQPDAIGNFVWDDTNGDGLQDPGEPGIDGVSVNLFLDDGGSPGVLDLGDTSVDTTTTAGGGFYLFTGVTPDTYLIEFDPSGVPGTWLFTEMHVGGDDTIDSDAKVATGVTDDFDYDGGFDDTRDAGLYQEATLGDRFWEDANGNGIQDGGETAASGPVKLLNSSMVEIDSTTATSFGYSFTGLAPGTYYVQFPTLCCLQAYTVQDAGGDDTVDSDVDATGKTSAIVLSSGEVDVDSADAGLFNLVTLSDFVWDDLDLDGEQDALEPGIDGVTLNLLSGGGVVDTEATAGGGLYAFAGVAPGTYEIEIVVPGGKALTLKDATTDDKDSDADQSTAKTDPFAVVSGVNQDTWDFGLVPLIDPPMTGLLWERWTGIPGAFVPNLTSHPDYPASPDITTMHMGDFHIPLGGLNIGDRVRGFVIPSVTDTYTFWVASDVRAEVFLSSDADPANLINGGSPIALVPFWTNTFHWNKYLEQMSAPVALEAGKAYYIEGLHKNNHLGNGNFSVGWSRAGDPNIFVIPQANLWIWKGIGDIHIEKVAPGGTGFGFTHSIPDGVGGFSLDDGASKSFTVPAGVTFTVTEDDPGPEWQLDSLLCDDPAGSGSVPARTATITLADGDAVTCTYTNIPTFGSIHGFKFEDAVGDGEPYVGSLDAFVANSLQPNVAWFNDGAGGFTASAGLGSADSFGVALGDVDGDGDLDAYVANSGANVVWVNQGGVQAGTEGVFVAGPGLGSANSVGVALGDVDGDGDLDAYVANVGAPNVVWVNQGGVQAGTEGVFVAGPGLGSADSFGVALGDVDGDGDLDAYVTNFNEPNVVWVNQGGVQAGTEGVFVAGPGLGSAFSFGVALGDVDGDGDLDAYVANLVVANVVWVNQGGVQAGTEGVFVAGPGLGSADSVGVALGDVDGDGDLDAYVANLGAPNVVWVNQGGVQAGTEGVFVAGPGLGFLDLSSGVALGDVDGDGDLDAYVAIDGDPNVVWVNQGGVQAGTEGVFVAGAGLGSADSFGVALGDLNGIPNGPLKPPLAGVEFKLTGTTTGGDPVGPIMQSTNAAGEFWFEDLAPGTYTVTETVPAGYVSTTGASAMITIGPGEEAVALPGQAMLDPGQFETVNPDLFFGNALSGSIHGYKFDDAVGDGEAYVGSLDAFVANSLQPNVAWFNDGAGGFTAGAGLGSANGRGVALGDVDGDGDLDAYVANSTGIRMWCG